MSNAQKCLMVTTTFCLIFCGVQAIEQLTTKFLRGSAHDVGPPPRSGRGFLAVWQSVMLTETAISEHRSVLLLHGQDTIGPRVVSCTQVPARGALDTVVSRSQPVAYVALAEAYLHTKWHLNPCSHLATTDMGQKLGEGLCFFGEAS